MDACLTREGQLTVGIDVLREVGCSCLRQETNVREHSEVAYLRVWKISVEV